MQEIPNIPEGYEIDLENSDLTVPVIKYKIKRVEFPTTAEECIPYLPDRCCFINIVGKLSYFMKTQYDAVDRNTLTSDEYGEAFLALMELIKYRDIWNKGWVADFCDETIKYAICFNEGKKEHCDFQFSHVPLVFEKYDIRHKFSKEFDELIQKAKPLL